MQKKDKLPPGYDINKWMEGISNLEPLLEFDERIPGFGVDLPDNPMENDIQELYFFKLFITDELIEDMTDHTNLYYEQYVSANSDSITEFSRTNKYPKNGITSDDMVSFIALIFYMGLVKKNDVKDYWFKDFVLETPFVRTVMSRGLFLNIMQFFIWQII